MRPVWGMTLILVSSAVIAPAAAAQQDLSAEAAGESIAAGEAAEPEQVLPRREGSAGLDAPVDEGIRHEWGDEAAIDASIRAANLEEAEVPARRRDQGGLDAAVALFVTAAILGSLSTAFVPFGWVGTVLGGSVGWFIATLVAAGGVVAAIAMIIAASVMHARARGPRESRALSLEPWNFSTEIGSAGSGVTFRF